MIKDNNDQGRNNQQETTLSITSAAATAVMMMTIITITAIVIIATPYRMAKQSILEPTNQPASQQTNHKVIGLPHGQSSSKPNQQQIKQAALYCTIPCCSIVHLGLSLQEATNQTRSKQDDWIDNAGPKIESRKQRVNKE